MIKKISVCFMLMCAFIAIGCGSKEKAAPPAAPAATSAAIHVQKGVVNGDDVFVREGPSSKHKPLFTVSKGTRLEILVAQKNDPNKKLYILKPDRYAAVDLDTNQEIILHKGLALEYVGQGETPTSAICIISVNGQDKRVLLKSGFGSGRSDVVDVFLDENWYNVRFQDGKTGWIFSKYVDFVDTIDKNATSQAGAGVVVKGLPPVSELLADNAIYGVHVGDDFHAQGEKFKQKGWRVTQGMEDGYFSGENEFGYTQSIYYSPSSKNVAYHIAAKDRQGLAAYADSIKKELTKLYGDGYFVNSGYKIKILEFESAAYYINMYSTNNEMSVGMRLKSSVPATTANYGYLFPVE